MNKQTHQEWHSKAEGDKLYETISLQDEESSCSKKEALVKMRKGKQEMALNTASGSK